MDGSRVRLYDSGSFSQVETGRESVSRRSVVRFDEITPLPEFLYMAWPSKRAKLRFPVCPKPPALRRGRLAQTTPANSRECVVRR